VKKPDLLKYLIGFIIRLTLPKRAVLSGRLCFWSTSQFVMRRMGVGCLVLCCRRGQPAWAKKANPAGAIHTGTVLSLLLSPDDNPGMGWIVIVRLSPRSELGSKAHVEVQPEHKWIARQCQVNHLLLSCSALAELRLKPTSCSLAPCGR